MKYIVAAVLAVGLTACIPQVANQDDEPLPPNTGDGRPTPTIATVPP